MASIPATTAENNTDIARAALVAADNAIFIADVDKQILDYIALGKKEISATTFGYVHIKDIYNYYTALGYHVDFPDLRQGHKFQPADLFGQFWIEFWNHTLIPHHPRNPTRVLINWHLVP